MFGFSGEDPIRRQKVCRPMTVKLLIFSALKGFVNYYCALKNGVCGSVATLYVQVISVFINYSEVSQV
jgi:hypothetical protein